MLFLIVPKFWGFPEPQKTPIHAPDRVQGFVLNALTRYVTALYIYQIALMVQVVLLRGAKMQHSDNQATHTWGTSKPETLTIAQ